MAGIKVSGKGGRLSLFPGKRRGRTISITVTDPHYELLDETMRRLNLTRSDVLALLVDRFARLAEIPATLPTPDED